MLFVICVNMSKNIKRNENFLKFFLETNSKQQAALLETLSKDQALVLSEITKNLLHLNIKPQTKVLLKKKSRLIKKLTDSKTPLKERLRIFKKYQKYWITIFLTVKDNLLQLL